MALVFAALSVTTRQIFRAAIYLLFTLISIAGIYFWLQYEFIAAVQIVVYVGGIVVLIIFSIFLTQQTGEKLPKQKLDRKIFAAFDCPAHVGEFLIKTSVAGDITGDLVAPIVGVFHRHGSVAMGASVPETTIDENDDPFIVKDDIGLAEHIIDIFAPAAHAHPRQHCPEFALQ
jgi:hypothetical protein